MAKPTRPVLHEPTRKVVLSAVQPRKQANRASTASRSHRDTSAPAVLRGESHPAPPLLPPGGVQVASAHRNPPVSRPSFAHDGPVRTAALGKADPSPVTASARRASAGRTGYEARLAPSGRERHSSSPEELAARAAIAAADRHRSLGDPLQRPASRGELRLATPARSAEDPEETLNGKTFGDTREDNIAAARLSGSQLRTIEQEASTPVILPSLYDARGRLVMPPPLKGSREILLHQNEVADRDGLARVQDDTDLLDLRREKKLVPLPADAELRIDERLPENRRFARPWAAQFLANLARDHFAEFHLPLQVNSAVRTVEFQQRLLRTNGNAAPADGDTASPHLTGQAVDIAKRGLSLTEIAWMRAYLAPLIQQGKIDVEEEFQQSCFHISIYKTYAPAAPHFPVVAAHRAEQPASTVAAE